MSQPTVLVVTDHALVYDRLRTALEPSFVVMTLVAHPESVVAVVGAVDPTILLVDLLAASVRGEEVIARVREELPEQRIVALAESNATPLPEPVAVVHRGESLTELPLKIREILGGGKARYEDLPAEAARWVERFGPAPTYPADSCCER